MAKRTKQFRDMTPQEFQDSYMNAVQTEMSYMGGNGIVEDDLWWVIKAHQKWARRHDVQLPEYESIECTAEDWV